MKLPNILPLVNKALKPLDNKVVGTTARVALILYASLIAPELPEVIARQLDNIAVRAVLIFLIAYLAIKDPITAALATLALMVTVMSLHRREVQGVLGAVGNLTEGARNLAGGVVGGAVDIAEDVVGGAVDMVSGALGYDGAEAAPVEVEQPIPEGI